MLWLLCTLLGVVYGVTSSPTDKYIKQHFAGYFSDVTSNISLKCDNLSSSWWPVASDVTWKFPPEAANCTSPVTVRLILLEAANVSGVVIQCDRCYTPVNVTVIVIGGEPLTHTVSLLPIIRLLPPVNNSSSSSSSDDVTSYMTCDRAVCYNDASTDEVAACSDVTSGRKCCSDFGNWTVETSFELHLSTIYNVSALSVTIRPTNDTVTPAFTLTQLRHIDVIQLAENKTVITKPIELNDTSQQENTTRNCSQVVLPTNLRFNARDAVRIELQLNVTDCTLIDTVNIDKICQHLRVDINATAVNSTINNTVLNMHLDVSQMEVHPNCTVTMSSPVYSIIELIAVNNSDVQYHVNSLLITLQACHLTLKTAVFDRYLSSHDDDESDELPQSPQLATRTTTTTTTTTPRRPTTSTVTITTSLSTSTVVSNPSSPSTGKPQLSNTSPGTSRSTGLGTSPGTSTPSTIRSTRQSTFTTVTSPVSTSTRPASTAGPSTRPTSTLALSTGVTRSILATPAATVTTISSTTRTSPVTSTTSLTTSTSTTTSASSTVSSSTTLSTKTTLGASTSTTPDVSKSTTPCAVSTTTTTTTTPVMSKSSTSGVVSTTTKSTIPTIPTTPSTTPTSTTTTLPLSTTTTLLSSTSTKSTTTILSTSSKLSVTSQSTSSTAQPSTKVTPSTTITTTPKTPPSTMTSPVTSTSTLVSIAISTDHVTMTTDGTEVSTNSTIASTTVNDTSVKKYKLRFSMTRETFSVELADNESATYHNWSQLVITPLNISMHSALCTRFLNWTTGLVFTNGSIITTAGFTVIGTLNNATINNTKDNIVDAFNNTGLFVDWNTIIITEDEFPPLSTTPAIMKQSAGGSNTQVWIGVGVGLGVVCLLVIVFCIVLIVSVRRHCCLCPKQRRSIPDAAPNDGNSWSIPRPQRNIWQSSVTLTSSMRDELELQRRRHIDQWPPNDHVTGNIRKQPPTSLSDATPQYWPGDDVIPSATADVTTASSSSSSSLTSRDRRLHRVPIYDDNIMTGGSDNVTNMRRVSPDHHGLPPDDIARQRRYISNRASQGAGRGGWVQGRSVKSQSTGSVQSPPGTTSPGSAGGSQPTDRTTMFNKNRRTTAASVISNSDPDVTSHRRPPEGAESTGAINRSEHYDEESFSDVLTYYGSTGNLQKGGMLSRLQQSISKASEHLKAPKVDPIHRTPRRY